VAAARLPAIAAMPHFRPAAGAVGSLVVVTGARLRAGLRGAATTVRLVPRDVDRGFATGARLGLAATGAVSDVTAAFSAVDLVDFRADDVADEVAPPGLAVVLRGARRRGAAGFASDGVTGGSVFSVIIALPAIDSVP